MQSGPAAASRPWEWDLWAEAANKLELSEKDRKSLFSEGSIKGNIAEKALAAAEERQAARKRREWTFTFRGKSINIRHVLQNIMKWRGKFEKVVDFAMSHDKSGHAALPWAGVKYLLDIASMDLEKYARMALGMEFVAREIHFYTIFEVVYLKEQCAATKLLSNTLVDSYTELLGYVVTAKKYYDQRLFVSLAKAPFQEDDVGNMMTSIENARVRIQQHAGVLDKQAMDTGFTSLRQGQKEFNEELAALKQPLESIGVHLAEIENTTKRNLALSQQTQAAAEKISTDIGFIISLLEERKDTDTLAIIRQHLGLPSSKEIHREYSQKLRELIPGTGAWVLEQHAFSEWMRPGKAVLSLCGSPGCGKSYLSTMILTHLFAPRDPSLLIGHYFFHENDERKRSLLNALCSMVYQIAEQNEEFAQHAALTCKKLISFDMASSIWDDLLNAKFEPKFNFRLCLVFDGVDEAKAEDVKTLVALLKEYLRDGTKIQVLLVGRPEISRLVSPLEPFSVGTIQVSSAVNSQDIARFIDHKYQQYLSKLKIRGLRKSVTSTLLKNAGGMFLWVDLVYQELKELKTAKKIRDHLDSMPSDLTKLYERIFSRMKSESDPKQVGALRELFCCLAHRKEPPTVLFLNQLIQFTTQDPRFEVEKTIENACASIITYEETALALFKKMTRDWGAETPNEADEADEELEDEEDEDDDSTSLRDEDEVEEEEKERQNEINVKLCHASVSDYLKSQDLKTSEISFSKQDGAFHVLGTILRIVCAGSEAPEELWLYAVCNMCDQLRYVNELGITAKQAVGIIEHLWEIFNSEQLGRYISQPHSTSTGYPLQSDSFFFGRSEAGNSNRHIIQKWLEKANPEAAQLSAETRAWMTTIQEDSMKLLVPLTKICIREWLTCDAVAPQPEFYWRYSFAWRCFEATNLQPQGSNSLPWASESPLMLPDNYPGGTFNFLADLIQVERSINVYCAIGRTIAFCSNEVLAKIEYDKAIELGEKLGDTEKLKKIYLESVLSLTSTALMTPNSTSVSMAEKYLALDQANYQVQACWGWAQWKDRENLRGAIEALRAALAMEPTDKFTVGALVNILTDVEEYEELIRLFDDPSDTVSGYRIRACLEDETLQMKIFNAAYQAGKMEVLASLYESEISKPWREHPWAGKSFSRSRDQWRCGWDGNGNSPGFHRLHHLWKNDWGVGMYNVRQCYKEGSSLLRCWLAVFYQDFLGKPQAALRHFDTALLRNSNIFELWKLSSDHSDYFTNSCAARFAQVLYDEALRPDGAVDEHLLKALQQLKRLHDAFHSQNLLGDAMVNGKYVNLFLAKLYLHCGKAREAQDLLNEQFRRAMDIVRNYRGVARLGYPNLSKLLFTLGRKNEAAIALCLGRFSCSGGDTSRCSRWFVCQSPGTIGRATPVPVMYTCMTCMWLSFCQSCYSDYINGGGAACHRDHEHVKTPLEGWDLKDENTMIIGGQKLLVDSWLQDMESKWKY